VVALSARGKILKNLTFYSPLSQPIIFAQLLIVRLIVRIVRIVRTADRFSRSP
jgi:hypothetical protein